MIDYIKIALPNSKYFDSFYNDKRYNWKQFIDLETQEVKYPIRGYHSRMKLVINRKYIIISGSIHKYYNLSINGLYQNYGDFTLTELRNAIKWLENDFDFDSKDAIIQNLEFGFNLQIKEDPVKFMENSMVHMKMKEPSIETFRNGGQFRQFAFSQYYWKMYDKGKQYGINRNTLRIEIKTRRSQSFVPKNTKWSLHELTKPQVLDKLFKVFITKYDSILFCGPIEKNKNINEKDRLDIEIMRNPKFWSGLKDTYSSSTINRRRKKFDTFKQKYGLDKDEKLLRRYIRLKYASLKNTSKLIGHNLH